MIKCGFFNSVNGDRVYGANDLNNFFEGIVSDGVFRKFKREMEVTAPGGMAVRVLPGKAICMEKYIHITAAEDITVESGNAQPRYDAVVISVSLDDREGYLYIKKGEEAATPEPPALYDNDTVKEMALAYIYVPANATEILAENITDRRQRRMRMGETDECIGDDSNVQIKHNIKGSSYRGKHRNKRL